jgi:hypothetical protein
MSRTSPLPDPIRWHDVVMDWLEERGKSRRRTAGVPAVLHERFYSEIANCIRLAKSGSVQHATAIAAHFYWATKKQYHAHPLVVEYIDKAREKFNKDPRRSKDQSRRIARALGLVRDRRGNPGRVPTKKRRLTPEGFIDAGQVAANLIDSGKPEKDAVEAVANLLVISERTVRQALAEERAARASRPSRRNREFPE